LSFTGLDDDGIGEICESIRLNRSVTSLNLSYNYFGEVGAERLRAALIENSTLKRLDLSRNALGFQSINALLCSCSPKGVSVKTNGEEFSRNHSVGFYISAQLV
jgi:Ran GTPase-activating protein (RanGAP) involved in mRNA processing and transport